MWRSRRGRRGKGGIGSSRGFKEADRAGWGVVVGGGGKLACNGPGARGDKGYKEGQGRTGRPR
jgi:hypothetical protein